MGMGSDFFFFYRVLWCDTQNRRRKMERHSQHRAAISPCAPDHRNVSSHAYSHFQNPRQQKRAGLHPCRGLLPPRSRCLRQRSDQMDGHDASHQGAGRGNHPEQRCSPLRKKRGLVHIHTGILRLIPKRQAVHLFLTKHLHSPQPCARISRRKNAHIRTHRQVKDDAGSAFL